MEHPLFERAASDIYGANYTYVDSDAGVADLDLRWSVLSQAALAAPVVLWPPTQGSPQPAAPGVAGQSGKAARFRPPEQWPALVAEAHDAAKQAAAERVAQQERLVREAESLLRAQLAAEAAVQAAVGEAALFQPGRPGSGVPAPPRMQSETSGTRSAGMTPQPPVGAAPPPVAEQKPQAGASISQQLTATAEDRPRVAASGEQVPASEGLRAPAETLPEGAFEDSVIFVGTVWPLLAVCWNPLHSRVLLQNTADITKPVLQATTGPVPHWCCGCNMR